MTPEQSMTFCFLLPNLDPCMLRIKHPSVNCGSGERLGRVQGPKMNSMETFCT